MVVCDSEGVVYDLWFHPASYHEVWLRYRLVAVSESLKYGGNFSPEVSFIITTKIMLS
jgi:hypothetical protein